jgi:hypothetical protein
VCVRAIFAEVETGSQRYGREDEENGGANINMQVADAKSDAHKLARWAKTERRNEREDCTHSYCCCKGGGPALPLCVCDKDLLDYTR